MKQFKTESKRILDLMINSIYTNREIFLRELISNASDALDKLHFMSLTDDKVDSNFAITLSYDKAMRTLTISDNGIGMTKDELEKNLGIIANSGTLKFKNEFKTDEDMIGQFGVGFYSAFMVSDRITVISKAYGADEAYEWTSAGAEGYDIETSSKLSVGTTIILHLKPNDEDCEYDKFLSDYELKNLIKKYSDYIRYPIQMNVAKERLKEGSDKEYETYTEIETLNSMVPIWKKQKGSVKDEEYIDFYKRKFHDYSKPRKIISANIEGNVNYNALIFIPEHAPFDYYTKNFQKGLQLYSNGVLIMEVCSDLIPEYLGFLRGIVDTGEISLNISREMLQKDRQLKTIATSLEKKIISELKKMLESDRENYDAMFSEYAKSIKYGAYDNYGEKKDVLKDILLFHSAKNDKFVTLKDYVDKMPESQKFIYYSCGESIAKIAKLPQNEKVLSLDYDILYLEDNIDEFVLKLIESYMDKQFKNVAGGDLGLDSDEDKEEIKKTTEENKELFDFVLNELKDKVGKVRLSSRMSRNAVCVTADGDVSIEMEKVFSALDGKNAFKAQRVFEINPSHDIFVKLKALFNSDKDKLKDYIKVLYGEAALAAGLEVDAAELSEAINRLLV